MRWWTGDEHYGHIRICELAGRPFPHGEGPEAVGLMNKELIRRFNERVGEDDETIHLGDFAMGAIKETLPIVAQLDGWHDLVPGNHDRCFPGYGKAQQYLQWTGRYHSAGFRVLHFTDYGCPKTRIAGEAARICHFPYRGDSQDKDRYAAWRPQDDGCWLLHGHVHQKWRQRGRMINVGVDAWGGYPVSEEQIAELIGAGPRDLEVLPW